MLHFCNYMDPKFAETFSLPLPSLNPCASMQKNLLNARSPSHFDGSSDSFNNRICASHQNQSVKLNKKQLVFKTCHFLF